MSDDLRLSVVVPAFRAAPYLAEALTSVLTQDRPPDEVVVVDDGSDDATAEVAEGFAPTVRLVRHAANRGVAAARNTGVTATTGELVAMHDADDVMRPDRLRRQVDALVAAGPEVVAVFGRVHSFTDDGTPLPPWAEAGTAGDAPYGIGHLLLRREALAEVGPFDESMRVGEDTDWVARAEAAGRTVLRLDAVLADRRWHAANLSAPGAGPHRAEFAHIARKRLAARRAAGDRP